MLSKEAFRANVDLKIFMEELGIECKPYLAKSRTAMLAKMLRIVEKAEKQQLLKYIAVINQKISDIPEEEKYRLKIKRIRKII